MNKTFYFPDMRVNEGDLNNTEQSRADAVRQQFAFMLAKFAHQYTGSIAAIAQQTLADATPNPTTYRGIGGGLNSGYLLPITGSLSQISVQRGWAITDSMDIVILTGSVTINQGDNDFNRVWGTLTNGQPAYVTAEYQEASASIGSDSSGNTYFKRYTGDFRIRVSATYPSGANQIPLAQFTANGNLITVNTFQDRREWARPWGVSDSILDKSPVVVSLTTLYDHTHAVGTGTPATTNPHGLSLNDLGFTDSLVRHRILEHGNGIIIKDKTISGALQSYSASVVSPTSNAFLSFSPLTAATASINGVLFSGSLPSLSASTVTDGDYWVVSNQSGQTSFISTGSLTFDDNNPVRNPQYLLLGKATVADSGDDITAFTDLRYIYTMSPAEIRAVTSASIPSVAFGRTTSLYDDIATLHGALGILLTGSVVAYPDALPQNFSQRFSQSAGTQDYVAGTAGNVIKGTWNPFSYVMRNVQGASPVSVPRALNTVYQNMTGRTLFVAVGITFLAADSESARGDFSISHNGDFSGVGQQAYSLGQGGISSNTSGGTVAIKSSMSGFVPQGTYYKVKKVVVGGGSSATLEDWTEMS